MQINPMILIMMAIVMVMMLYMQIIPNYANTDNNCDDDAKQGQGNLC